MFTVFTQNCNIDHAYQFSGDKVLNAMLLELFGSDFHALLVKVEGVKMTTGSNSPNETVRQ
jgi:hypothetical protein